MPIVLRLTKGSELTFAELDGNFTDLDNRVDTIEEANLISRVTRLEQAGTPIYFDSDDVMVMLDSIWAGGVDSYLATTDSIGLASFDSDHFNVNSGHVTIKLAGYTPSDSAGIASFDSSNFVVSAGHVIINPNSAAGRVAGTTIIDSTGVASFDSDDFNVNTNGHVTLTDSAVRTRISAVNNSGAGSFAYRESTGEFVYDGPALATTSTVGVASFNSSDFTVSSGVVSLAGGSGIPVSSSLTAIGSFMFVQSWGMPVGEKYQPGDTIPGSRLRYGRFQNGIVGPNSGSFTRPNASPTPSSLEAFYYNGSDNCSSTLPGSWRLLGPGTMAYYNGSGSNQFGLVQRIS